MAAWFEAPLSKLEDAVDTLIAEKGCISNIQPALTQLREQQQAIQADSKQQLKELAKEVEFEQNSSPVCRSKDEYVQLLDDLGAQQHETAMDLSKKEQSVSSMRAEIARLKAETDKLEKDQTQLDSEMKALKKQRAKVLLYMRSSNIKWDYSDASSVKGFVVKEQEQLQTFELDPNKHSQYFIADRLWAQVAWSARQ
eukprot:m.163373 g.163373  ORF g.163373 m.163373 type:complete len:197 (-) comp16548_c0_seq2:3615-4205(-)